MTLSGKLDATDLKIAIVVSRWNELVTKALLDGALGTLKQLGAGSPLVVMVPGAWEIPMAARDLIQHRKVDAVVALGCILQGATGHAGQLASDVSSALMKLQLDSGVPISWGILTPENQEQALERAGMKLGNKGREAASSAVEGAQLSRALASKK